MISSDTGSQSPFSRKEHTSVPVRLPVFFPQAPSTQPQISLNLQKIFHKTLIPLSSDSPAINRKSSELNNDFGLLVCEINALFKVIHNQGVATAPDFSKLDSFEQRLDELNLELDDSGHTQKERARAAKEINKTKESIEEVRELAKQLETYHPLSTTLGESEARFVDRYNSDRPGSALMATEEFTIMLNDFTSLRQNVFDPFRKKTDEDRLRDLYKEEQEELVGIVEEWTQQIIVETSKEIKELSRCIENTKEEDKTPFQRQAIALDGQLTRLKAKIRNSKAPDSALKSPLQSLVLNIHKQQLELHKIIDSQESKDVLPLQYGQEEWLNLVKQRAKESESWLKTTITQLNTPSEWNSTVKNMVKTLFDGILLFEHIKGNNTENSSQKIPPKEGNESFKASHIAAKTGQISVSKDPPLIHALSIEDPSNFSFIHHALSSIQSVPLELYANRKYERLQEMGQSLDMMQGYLSRMPAEQREEFTRSLDELYRETVNIAQQAPHALSAVARADWMQSVDDLLYAKSVFEQEFVQKAVELKDLKLLAALGKNNIQVPMDMIVTDEFTDSLEHSIQEGRSKDVRDFLSAIDINAKNTIGEALIHKISVKGLVEILKILESVPDVDLNLKDSNGNTALHLAAYNGYTELIQILSAHSLLDLNEKTIFGKTALTLAITENHSETAEALIADPRLDINLLDDNMRTPLMLAIIYQHWSVAKTLIADSRIDLNPQNQHGFTALDLAEIYMNNDIAELIRQSGKDAISDEKKNFKILGHSWELKGKVPLGIQEVIFTGYKTTLFVDFIVSSFSEFHKEHPDFISDEQFTTIFKSLNSLKSFSSENAINDFKNGLPIIISTGSTNHAISVVIHKSYLMICNKGDGTLRPIEAYKIDPGKLTKEMIVDIQNCMHKPLSEGFNVLFGKSFNPNAKDSDREFGPLLQGLKAERNDKTCHWLENLPHTSRIQKVGNCAWESPETAVYAIMGLLSALKSDLTKLSSMEEKQLAEKTYEAFKKWEKFTQLEAVIQSLRHIEKRILSNPEHRDSMNEAYFRVRSTYVRDDNQDFWKKRRVIQAKLDNIPKMLVGETQTSILGWTLQRVSDFFNAYMG